MPLIRLFSQEAYSRERFSESLEDFHVTIFRKGALDAALPAGDVLELIHQPQSRQPCWKVSPVSKDQERFFQVQLIP